MNTRKAAASRLPRVPPAAVVQAVMRFSSFLQRVRRRLLPAEVSMLEMLSAAAVSRSIFVALELRVADHLADGPRTAAELASKCDADANALDRMLRALASVGVFTREPDGRYALTPMAHSLRTDRAGPVQGIAALAQADWYTAASKQLAYSVRTGLPAFEHVHGTGIFDFLRRDPDAWQVFNTAMTRMSDLSCVPVAAGYDFSGIHTLVDVAGGHGRLLATVLTGYPAMRGVLFDQPGVVEGARATFDEAGVSDRCDLVAGSFFESIPDGGDAYMMKHIIHDWDDARATQILRGCRDRLRTNGRVLVVEAVIPTDNEPFFGKFLDLDMLILTHGGRERTEAEYRALFAGAGLRLRRVVPTASPMSVLEAVPG